MLELLRLSFIIESYHGFSGGGEPELSYTLPGVSVALPSISAQRLSNPQETEPIWGTPLSNQGLARRRDARPNV